MLRQGAQAYRNVLAGLVLPVTLAGCLMHDPVEPADVSNAPPPTGTNNPPEIWGNAPRVVKVGVAYSFTPQATDPDADPLSFSINNEPAWLTFDSTNGRISGVPLLGNEGTYNDIEIAVSDGQASTMLPRFSISVEPNTTPNMPPEIDGTPATSVSVGDTYTFTPTGSDPDGDPLTFSIQNLPLWAQFDTAAGALSGTPQVGDENSYANIVISVSDGALTTSLPAFSITVNTISVGSVTLNWTPPTQNIDGSPLANLAGYVIYYGLSPGNYSGQVALNNPGLSSYTVNNLAPNTYYFAMTAVNSLGVASDYSNVASKTIN